MLVYHRDRRRTWTITLIDRAARSTGICNVAKTRVRSSKYESSLQALAAVPARHNITHPGALPDQRMMHYTHAADAGESR